MSLAQPCPHGLAIPLDDLSDLLLRQPLLVIEHEGVVRLLPEPSPHLAQDVRRSAPRAF